MSRRSIVHLLAGTLLLATPFPGNAASSFSQAVKFERGGNYASALRIFRSLAMKGNNDAEYELGEMYEYGFGVPRNDTLAFYWYRKASAAGTDAYQFRMGWMYELGKGTPVDGPQAVQWFRKAAEKGYSPAQDELAKIFRDGRLVPPNPKEAAFWERKLEANPHFRRITVTPRQLN